MRHDRDQAKKTILTNATLIDCVGREPVPGASVMIQDGRIGEVLDSHRSPDIEEAQVIDLKGSYLLPGLWDVHMHLDWPPLSDPTIAEQTVRFGYNAMQGLTQAGVVGLRTGGTAEFIDVVWKRAFDSWQYLGPRIFAGGNLITTTAGGAVHSGFAKECDGPYDFVQAVREQIKNGVDHIKLGLTGFFSGPVWGRGSQTFLLKEELEAVFSVCHQRDYKVMVHATNPEAVKSAISLGAHTIEHGQSMDEECIGLFVERGVWYIPTLSHSHLTPSQATTPWENEWLAERKRYSLLSEDVIKQAEDIVDEHRHWFQRALQAGVKIALGSDLKPPSKGPLLEMELWVKDGATPWQTLIAATRNAAEVCGIGNDLGTVEVGKLADLIVVRQNPLEDISNLRSLELVLKEGRLVADHRMDVA